MTGPADRRPSSRALWLRWSWRDLRAHWVAVVAIALVIAVGTGVYAGLGSTSTWRRASNDASFAALGMHDLRIALSRGTFTGEGSLAVGVRGIRSADEIVAVAERLVVGSQLEVSTETEQVLVPARVVGMSLGADNPGVDDVWLRSGQLPQAAAPRPAALLETKFADAWNLDTVGSVTLGGGKPVDHVGLGTIPDDFLYEGPDGSLFSLGDLAPLYLHLRDAQALVGRPGQVNEVVLTLRDGADRAAVAGELEALVDELGVSATVTTREDAYAVHVMYEDIDNDQRFWNALAALILAAAALAAFNLISRIVEAQRREIGIGMSLGVPRRQLAIRPTLVGLQIAAAGAAAGVGAGMLVGRAMKAMLESFLPLPVYITDFQVGVFARAALLGVAIPVVAAAIPVWRAVRVEPIEAIRTGHLAARTSRLTDWSARVRLPGSTTTQMPIRNVLRTPRRTLLTALGVGASITALVATLGLLDSFGRAIDQVGEELTQGDHERVLVQLDTFYGAEVDVVRAIRDLPSTGVVDVGLRLPAVATSATSDERIDLLLDVVDLDAAGWTPTFASASDTPEAGVILARKAADDLDVALGDQVTLRHPQWHDGAFSLAESELVVSAIHANPLRTFAYLDRSNAERFGLAGFTNALSVYPAADSGRADLQRDLFGIPGVTSSQAVARIGAGMDSVLEQFVGFLAVVAVAVFVLALLIAFNATRIAVEERRREHATMRAFGLPVRSVIGVVVKESVLIGLGATAIGIVAGLVFLDWMLGSLAATTLPDLGIAPYLRPTTIVAAVVVGTVTVAVAPMFLTRRIRRMNIPDALRVME